MSSAGSLAVGALVSIATVGKEGEQIKMIPKDNVSALDSKDTSVILPSPRSPVNTLTTRQILPHYKLENIHQFMETFAKVDV